MFKDLIKQILNFSLVGLVATLLDYLVFAFLFNGLGWHYILASLLAFVLATLANYGLTLKFVFQSRFGKDEKFKEFFLFFILAVLALCLTLFLMAVCVRGLGIHPNLSKLLVTACVMVFNFLTRKGLIEVRRPQGKEPPYES